MKRALVLCPGRGSYGRDSLGKLKGVQSPALDVFEAMRRELDRPTVREIDGAAEYSSTFHLMGEHASALTAGVSLADLDQLDPSTVQVVGVVGNSMGWYTALGYAGALPMNHCALLVEAMGQYQADNIIGGQIMVPLVDEQWRLDPRVAQAVEGIVEDTPDLFWSIHLGGHAVLGGTTTALDVAEGRLKALKLGQTQEPYRIPMHSAFHTPLMASTAAQATTDLSELDWRAPRVPLIDGRGRVHTPHSANPAFLRDYTLGPQVTDTYDLSLCLRTALRTLGPDVVILPGPGSKLSSAVAQAMISEGWSGIHCQDDFVNRQHQEPVLLSMRWPDERAQVVAQ
jgi:[acyl-carrier-protein] S-malonyltransferase